MTDNKWLARGITKEGTFCFGYYVFDECRNKHYIFRYINRKNHPPFELKEETIQEPDTSLDIKDINGKDIFENDRGKIGDEEYIVKYCKEQGCFILDSEKTTERYLTKSTVENYGFKVIGNTHGIKEE